VGVDRGHAVPLAELAAPDRLGPARSRTVRENHWPHSAPGPGKRHAARAGSRRRHRARIAGSRWAPTRTAASCPQIEQVARLTDKAIGSR